MKIVKGKKGLNMTSESISMIAGSLVGISAGLAICFSPRLIGGFVFAIAAVVLIVFMTNHGVSALEDWVRNVLAMIELHQKFAIGVVAGVAGSILFSRILLERRPRGCRED